MAQPMAQDVLRARAIYRDNTATFRDCAIDESVFGDHWEYILLRRLKPAGDGGHITATKFIRLCHIFKHMGDQRVVPAVLSKQQIDEILAIGDQVDDEVWQREGMAIVVDVARRAHKLKVRSDLAKRADREGETPLPAGAKPPLMATIDQLSRYEGIVVEDNFLGPTDIATGRMDVMRAARDRRGQSLLPFADGNKLFPDDAIGMSTQDRANCPLPKQIFIIGGACAMVPYSLGEYREAVQNEIRSTDIRKKPSHWRCIERIYLAVTKKQPVGITFLAAALALYFYTVGESGDGASLWRHLKSLDLLVVLDPTFPWSDCIRGRDLYDGPRPSEGQPDTAQRLKNVSLVKLNFRRVADSKRTPLEEQKHFKALKGRHIQQRVGLNQEGKWVYRTCLDTITATDSQIRQLLTQQDRQSDDLEWANCEAIVADEGNRRDGTVVGMGDAQFEELVEGPGLNRQRLDPDGRNDMVLGRQDPVVASTRPPLGAPGNPIVLDGE